MKKIIKLALIICFALCSMASFATVYAQEQKVDWVSIVWGDNYYQEKDLPDGLKGHSYPVPECIAVDNHGNEINGVQILAYAPNGNIVPIIDGRIVTEESGVYEIVYEIEYLTFSASKTVTVYVLEESTISYQIHEDIASNYYTGQTILLPEGEMNGGLGLLTLSCRISFEGQPYGVYDFGGVKYFKPQKAGVYSVEFELSDYVGQKDVKKIDITVEDSNAPIMSEPSIQKINRIGETIKLPVVNAVLYKGEESYLVPVKVYVDGNEVTSNMEYVASLGGHVIKYVATNLDGSKSTEYVYSVKTLDCDDDQYNENYHFINNYFYLENFNTEYKNGSCYLVCDGSQTFAKMDFASKISAKQLSIEFAVDKDRSNFDTIDYKLVDSRDSDKSITLTLKKSNDKVNLYVNGKFGSSLDYSFSNSVGLTKLNLKIDRFSGVVYGADDNPLAIVLTYENGEKFSGFDSMYCYASIDISGVTGISAINFIRIANMNITDINYEVSSPIYNENDGFEDVIIAEINETVVLPFVEFFDPLDQNIEVKLTVLDPNGKVLINELITEDVEVVVDKYGSYSVEYMATDSSANHTFRNALISVVDREFPIISVEKIKGKVKIGETIELPNPTVDDNSGIDKLVSYIYVTTENSQRTIVWGNKYTFDKAGDYLITYVAMDETGNYSAIEFSVKCR